VERPQTWIGKPVRFGRLDRLTQIALVAAHHAVAGDALPSDGQRAGIVFGTALGSHLTNETFLRQMEQLGPAEVSPALFTYTLPSAAVGEISIHFGLQGPTVTLAQGVGAGIAALDLAATLVRRGEASWMLAGAADVLGPTLIAAAGPDAGDLTEDAAFFVVRPARRTNGGLARIGAAEQGRQEAQQLEDAALGRAAVVRHQLQAHLVYRARPRACCTPRSRVAPPFGARPRACCTPRSRVAPPFGARPRACCTPRSRVAPPFGARPRACCTPRSRVAPPFGARSGGVSLESGAERLCPTGGEGCATYDRSLSAAPLLGIAALLAGGALEAPVLVTVQDDQGLIDVLCLTPP